MSDGKKKAVDAKAGTEKEEEEEQEKESLWIVIWESYTGKRKSVIPMATFVFLQNTCFLLSQIATTFLVITYWGVNDIPYMILGVGGASLVVVVVAHFVEQKYHQRTLVLQSLWKTALTFWALRLWYYTSPGKTLSAICFVWVELCYGYDVDQFWLLIEVRSRLRVACACLRSHSNSSVPTRPGLCCRRAATSSRPRSSSTSSTMAPCSRWALSASWSTSSRGTSGCSRPT